MRFRMSTFLVGLVSLCVGLGGILVAARALQPSKLMQLVAPAGFALLICVGLYYVSWLVWRRR